MPSSLFVSMLLDLVFFFFNDTATTEIYTLSLHDALPIGHVLLRAARRSRWYPLPAVRPCQIGRAHVWNSSHVKISYAGFCLKKKKRTNTCGHTATKKNFVPKGINTSGIQ